MCTERVISIRIGRCSKLLSDSVYFTRAIKLLSRDFHLAILFEILAVSAKCFHMCSWNILEARTSYASLVGIPCDGHRILKNNSRRARYIVSECLLVHTSTQASLWRIIVNFLRESEKGNTFHRFGRRLERWKNKDTLLHPRTVSRGINRLITVEIVNDLKIF